MCGWLSGTATVLQGIKLAENVANIGGGLYLGSGASVDVFDSFLATDNVAIAAGGEHGLGGGVAVDTSSLVVSSSASITTNVAVEGETV